MADDFILRLGTEVAANGKDIQNQINKKVKDARIKAALDIHVENDELKKEINLVKSSFKEIKGFEINDRSAIQAIKRVKKEASEGLNLQFGKTQLNNNITSYLVNNTKLSSELRNKLVDIRAQIDKVDSSDLKNLQKSFRNVTSEAKALGQTGDSVFSRLKKNSLAFLNFLGSATIVMSGIRLFQNMVTEVKNLDNAMISLRKVTDETETSYKKFLNTAASTAKNLGSSISDIVEMTATWAKLGYTIEEASKLAEVSTIYANVGEINNTETAVSDLVTAMKAYGITANDAMSIADKFNEIGNKYATDAASLGTGLKNAASSLALAGNDIDHSLAMLTAMTEIIQDAGESGNALKILSMRLRGMKGALEELGEESEGIETISKIQTQILNLTGGKVNIFDDLDPTKFKSTYDIMLGISKVWSDISETDQAALLEIIAGKQRGNSIAALLTNMSQAENVLKTSLESSGSALREQEQYMKGIEYSADRMKASFQQLSSNTLNSDWVKGFYDLSNVLITVVDKIGLFNVALVALSGFIGAKSVLGVNAFASVLQGLATKLGFVSTTAGTAMAALSVMIPTAIIVGGLTLATIALDKFVVTLDEQKQKLEEAKTAYENSQSKLESINNELKTASQRMEELQKKGTLTFVEQSELDKLKEATTELLIQQDIERDKASRAAQKLSKENKNTYRYEIGTMSVDEYASQDLDKRYASSYNANNINQALAYKRLMEEALSTGNFDGVNIDDNKIFNREYLKKNIDEYVKIIDEGIAKVNDYRQPLLELQNSDYITPEQVSELEELTSLLQTLYYEAGKENEWKNIQFEGLKSNSETSKVISEFKELSKTEPITPEQINNSKELSAAISTTTLTAEDMANQINGLANETSNAGNSVASTKDEILSLSDALASISDSGDLLSSLNKEIKDNGTISAKILDDIIKKYPELEGVIADYLSGIASTKDVYNSLKSVYDKDVSNYKLAVIEKQKDDANFYKSVVKNLSDDVKNRAKSYDKDLENYTSLTNAKQAIDAEYEQKKLNLEKAKLIRDKANQPVTNLVGGVDFLQGFKDKGKWEENVNAAEKELDDYQRFVNEFNKGITASFDSIDFKIPNNDNDDNDKKKDSTKDFLQEIDWIKTRFDAVERSVSKLNDAYANADSDNQVEALEKLIAKQEKLTGIYKNGAKEYRNQYEANLNLIDSLGFNSEDIFNKIKWGANSVEIFEDLNIASDKTGIKEKLYDAIQDAVSNWNSYSSAVDNKVKVEYEIAGNKKELNELYRNIGLSGIEKSLGDLKETNDELDTMATLLGDVIVYDEFGKLTANGAAKLTILNSQLSTAEKSAKLYAEQIEVLNEQYLEGLWSSDEYYEKLKELKTEYRSAVTDLNSYKKAIMDLVVDGINAETTAYKDQISKILEVLEKKKKLEDSNKSLLDKQKKLAILQKNINALSSDENNRENNAQRLKLEAEYAKLKEEIDDEVADNAHQITVDSLNDQADVFEKAQNKKINELKNSLSQQEYAITNSLNIVSGQYESVYKNLVDLAASYGIQISNALTSPLENAMNSVTETGQSGNPKVNTSVYNVLKKNTTGEKQTAETGLNQYLISKGYNKLSWDEMVDLANSLGLTDITKNDVVNSGAIRGKILNKLKASGFSKGGLIKATGEDGTLLARANEYILTEKQVPYLEILSKNLPKLSSLSEREIKTMNHTVNNNSSNPIVIEKLLTIEGNSYDETTLSKVESMLERKVPSVLNNYLTKSKR